MSTGLFRWCGGLGRRWGRVGLVVRLCAGPGRVRLVGGGWGCRRLAGGCGGGWFGVGLERWNTRPPDSMARRFWGSAKAPPPEAMIWPLAAHRSAITWRSSRRKAGSPWSAKIWWMGFWARATISASASARGQPVAAARARPTLVLPEAMKPTRMMLRGGVIIVGPPGGGDRCVGFGLTLLVSSLTYKVDASANWIGYELEPVGNRMQTEQ